MKNFKQWLIVVFAAGALSLLSRNAFAAKNVCEAVASREHVRRQREAWLHRVMPHHVPDNAQGPAVRDSSAENHEASFGQWLLSYRSGSGLAISAVITSTALLTLSIYTHWHRKKERQVSSEVSNTEACPGV